MPGPKFTRFKVFQQEDICIRFLPVLLLTLLPAHAYSFSLSAGAAGGFEVMSYRDSPTDLTGGAVQAGDAFEQKSYTGAQVGVVSTVGIVRIDALEPIVGVDILHSKLKKSAVEDGFDTTGVFDFTHASLGLGARWWLGPVFAAGAQLQFSTAFGNKMINQKKVVADGASLGEVNFNLSGHKKTSLLLGFNVFPLDNGLSIGVDFKLGSGCFDCSSSTTALQHRSYLTRSGALTLAWNFADERADDRLDENGRKRNGSRVRPRDDEKYDADFPSESVNKNYPPKKTPPNRQPANKQPPNKKKQQQRFDSEVFSDE
ncbi:MAG: hypothetical protein RLZZ488_1269 [Pseudomonadota bacterium]|jgi:hypothetical protein